MCDIFRLFVLCYQIVGIIECALSIYMYHLDTSIVPLDVGVAALSAFGFLCVILSCIIIHHLLVQGRSIAYSTHDEIEQDLSARRAKMTIESRVLDMAESNSIVAFVSKH